MAYHVGRQLKTAVRLLREVGLVRVRRRLRLGGLGLGSWLVLREVCLVRVRVRLRLRV